MKKLGKLNLKEMEQEMHLVGSDELRNCFGGSGYTAEEIAFFNDLSDGILDAYNYVSDSVEDLYSNVSDFFIERNESFTNLAYTTIEMGVTKWLDVISSGTSSLGLFFYINNPDLLPSPSDDGTPSDDFL